MKFAFILILTFIAGNSLGQAKELNALFDQYAYTLYKQGPPLALQKSQELLFPGYTYSDEISVIKWKDIDSIRIFDTRKGGIIVDVYGKMYKYKNCNNSDSCNVKFIDSLYNNKISVSGTERIVFTSKNADKKLAQSKQVRMHIKNLFQRLNNTPVRENYSPCLTEGFGQASYNHIKKEIIIYRYDCDEGRIFISAKDLKNAKTFRVSLPNFTSVIVSFDLYITGQNPMVTIRNQAMLFNAELIKALQNIQPGDFLTFVNVKVKGNNGIRTIDEFVITVR